jgi:pectinesterase
VDADRVAFINCRFIANQDTIYTYGKGQRQYFRNCWIEGTTDFIFGASTCWFEDCTILSKRDSYITAASTPEGAEFGYVFRNCRLIHNDNARKVYLGRPWRPYAKTVFIDCELGDHIRPEGWHNWDKKYAEKTSYYAEYGSKGPGAEGKRVSWSHALKAKEVKKYTPENVLKTGTEIDKHGKAVPVEWYFKVF